MGRLLLLGAGFSRNWGGWLSQEISGDLLGRVQEDAQLSKLLNEAASFEDALSQVQEQCRANSSEQCNALLNRLQHAVLATFRAMNEAFATRPSMEFSNERSFSIINFLSRFDAIFTLNQDLLFELHYNLDIHEPRRWNGHYFPGMECPPGWSNAIGPFLRDRLAITWRPAATFHLESNLQPIFKLHGSVNWNAGEHGELLILGGNKAQAIGEAEILQRYMSEFRRYLEMPNTRLMVIGYGFKDNHIDEVLYESWKRSKFQMFLVSPRGRAILDRKTARGLKYPSPLQEIPLVGESMRPLSTTFRDDYLELGRLSRFFD